MQISKFSISKPVGVPVFVNNAVVEYHSDIKSLIIFQEHANMFLFVLKLCYLEMATCDQCC